MKLHIDIAGNHASQPYINLRNERILFKKLTLQKLDIQFTLKAIRTQRGIYTALQWEKGRHNQTLEEKDGVQRDMKDRANQPGRCGC